MHILRTYLEWDLWAQPAQYKPLCVIIWSHINVFLHAYMCVYDKLYCHQCMVIYDQQGDWYWITNGGAFSRYIRALTKTMVEHLVTIHY